MYRDKVYVIGVAPEGVCSLSPSSRRLVRRADIVFGGERLLAMFPSLTGETIAIKNNLGKIADLMRRNLGQKRMVVLGSGDPGFFGIARYLTGKLGRDAVEVVPNVSAMQVAFARIKESWDDAALLSVHSRPVEDIVGVVRSSRKTGIFTDDRHTPEAIARMLLERGIPDCRACVCEDLGSDKERVTTTTLSKLPGMGFSPLNVMILARDAEPEGARCHSIGIPEEDFFQREGRSLITKVEVRAIDLAKLGLNERSTVWDIGAGSGAVSIEASFLAAQGQVLAVEKDGDCIADIRKNIEKFRRRNITVVEAFAPEGLDRLPDPSAVFIGGSGGRLGPVLDCACLRLKPGGRIVGNFTTLENLHNAVSALEALGFETNVTLVNIARSTSISGLTRFEPLNPVFIVASNRKGEAAEG